MKREEKIAELEKQVLNLTNQIADSVVLRNAGRCGCPHCQYCKGGGGGGGGGGGRGGGGGGGGGGRGGEGGGGGGGGGGSGEGGRGRGGGGEEGGLSTGNNVAQLAQPTSGAKVKGILTTIDKAGEEGRGREGGRGVGKRRSGGCDGGGEESVHTGGGHRGEGGGSGGDRRTDARSVGREECSFDCRGQRAVPSSVSKVEVEQQEVILFSACVFCLFFNIGLLNVLWLITNSF